VIARIRWIASIVDSVPELLNRHSGRPKRWASASATAIESSVGCAKCVPWVTRRWTASTTAGLACPTTLTPYPAWTSTYSLPSASHTWLPEPRSIHTGTGRVLDQLDVTPPGITVLARSCSALDRGVLARNTSSSARIRSSIVFALVERSIGFVDMPMLLVLTDQSV
jgi:hypothetical protein